MAHAPDHNPLAASGCPLGRQVFAGCCEPLLEDGPSRHYLRESFPRCLDPYPSGSPSAYTRFFPGDIGLRPVGTSSASHNIRTATSVRETISGLQSFLYVQASGFARHPGRSYRNVPFNVVTRVITLGFGGLSTGFPVGLSPTPIASPCLQPNTWAAVAFTSEHITVCYLPVLRIC